jgi:hypothetical protein
MKKIIFLALVLSLLSLPLINADLITPGYKNIEIKNIITNLNDFPDYYFLSVCSEPMGRVFVIGPEGDMGACYKFSELEVYAVNKSGFNQTYLEGLMKQNRSAALTYFETSNSIKVISNVEFYKNVPIGSTEGSITNYYTIDLNKLKEQPDKKQIERNNLIYGYILVPIIALIIILAIIILRRKK